MQVEYIVATAATYQAKHTIIGLCIARTIDMAILNIKQWFY